MALSKEDRVRELAQLVGISVSEDDLSEVANRFDSLMQELDRLKQYDFTGIEPVMVFPDQEASGG